MTASTHADAVPARPRAGGAASTATKTPQPFKPSKGQRKRRREPYLLLIPALVMLALLFLFPAIYNVILAFQKLTPYQSPTDAVWVGFSNFVSVLTSSKTGIAVFNTAFWLTALTVILRLVFGMGLALLLQSPVLARWKVRGLARTLVLIPWMVSPTVGVAAWKWILDGQTGVLNQVLMQFGIIDQGIPFLAQTSTVWGALTSIIVWRELPFVVIVLMAGLQSIGHEQYEAASLDGAARWKCFIHVTLPNLRPVLTVIVLMTVIGTFNNFVYVWLTTGGGPGTYTQVLATQLYSTAFVDNKMGQGAAIGIVMTCMMAVFAVVYLRVTMREKGGAS